PLARLRITTAVLYFTSTPQQENSDAPTPHPASDALRHPPGDHPGYGRGRRPGGRRTRYRGCHGAHRRTGPARDPRAEGGRQGRNRAPPARPPLAVLLLRYRGQAVMVNEWADNTPIYVQLRERVLAQILDGAIRPGEPLPSVRQVAAELAINPLTVSKAYQALLDEGIVEKRRGLGLYVTEGADLELRKRERERFLQDEWPLI